MINLRRKIFMKRLFSIAAIIFIFCVPAFALSDSEYLKMKKDSDYAEADRILTKAYNDAKNSMNDSDFAKLKRSQRQWISKGRDEYARNLIREGYSKVEAYTQATLERAKEIRNEITLSTLSISDIAGYYDNGDEVYLFIDWKNRKKNLLEVSLSSYGENWKGSGTLKGDTLTAKDGGTSVTISVIDNDTVEIEANGAFRRAVGFDAEGTFSRHYGK